MYRPSICFHIYIGITLPKAVYCMIPLLNKKGVPSAQGSPLCKGWERVDFVHNLTLTLQRGYFHDSNLWPANCEGATLPFLPRLTNLLAPPICLDLGVRSYFCLCICGCIDPVHSWVFVCLNDYYPDQPHFLIMSYRHFILLDKLEDYTISLSPNIFYESKLVLDSMLLLGTVYWGLKGPIWRACMSLCIF